MWDVFLPKPEKQHWNHTDTITAKCYVVLWVGISVTFDRPLSLLTQNVHSFSINSYLNRKENKVFRQKKPIEQFRWLEF